MDTTESEVDELLQFPFAAPTPWEPPPRFAELRANRPVVRVRFPSGDWAWLVTRHADNRRVLGDPRFSRAAASAPGAPRLQPVPPDPASLLSMEGPAHTRVRQLVSRAFTPRRLAALVPDVEYAAARLVADMVVGGPTADLVAHLAMPLPITVICDLLGVPDGNRARFQHLADAVLSLTAHGFDEVRAARLELDDYFLSLIADKRRNPGDDLISALVSAHDEDEVLTTDELVALCRTLLTAGFHTTANQIGLAVLSLLRRPAGLRGLAPSGPLVEELLRTNPLTVGGGLIRVATEDVEVSGVLIRAGEAVLPAIGSANRDERVFTDAHDFRPDRSPNPHIAFGHGAHYCLGAPLARVELRAALDALVRLTPHLRLAVPLEDLEFSSGRLFRGLAALPVTWGNA